MNNYNLVEHDNGPGIAATVVLNLLLDELVKKKLLSHGDVARHLSSADGTVERMGEINHAVRDARSVLNKMRGIIRLLARCGRGWFWELLLWLLVLELARVIGG